jgi:quinol monooxygenase YgiN
MKHKVKLLELILAEDDAAMLDWIESQPLLDQPDILRELKQIAEEMAEENGDTVYDVITDPEAFDAFIDNYEDKILEEKLAEANYIIALEEQEKALQKMDEAIEGIRTYVIECIVAEAPNAAAMRGLAAKMIALEKESGTYDPENWKGIED